MTWKELAEKILELPEDKQKLPVYGLIPELEDSIYDTMSLCAPEFCEPEMDPLVYMIFEDNPKMRIGE